MLPQLCATAESGGIESWGGGGGGVESWGGGVVVSTGGSVGGVESLGDSEEAIAAPSLHARAPIESESRLPRSQNALRAPERAGIIRRPTNPSSAESSKDNAHYRQGAPRYPTPVLSHASFVTNSGVVKPGVRLEVFYLAWRTDKLRKKCGDLHLPVYAVAPPFSPKRLGQVVRK